MVRHCQNICLRAAVMAVISCVITALIPTTSIAEDRPQDLIVAAHYPPYAIGPDLERDGYAIDILRLAAQRAGRDVTVQFLPFNRALLALESRSDTLMPALFRIPQREKMFQWVATYDTSDLNVMSVESPVNTIDDVRTLSSVALERESFGDRFVSDLELGNLVYQTTIESSARMLNAGRVDAWIQSSSNAMSVWAQLGLDRPLRISPPIQSIPLYITAGLHFPVDASAAYSNAIQSLVDDGTIADIIASYR